MNDNDNPRVKSLTVGPAEVGPQRGMAAFMIVVGVLAAGRGFYGPQDGSPHHSGTWHGVQFGFGIAVFCLAILALWSASFTRRHLDESPTFWQTRQDRSRPRITLIGTVLGVFCLVLGGLIVFHGTSFVGGAILGIGAPPLALALCIATGILAPIRYQ
jgi:drug/metabolite transporter (DMT)-like permease